MQNVNANVHIHHHTALTVVLMMLIGKHSYNDVAKQNLSLQDIW